MCLFAICRPSLVKCLFISELPLLKIETAPVNLISVSLKVFTVAGATSTNRMAGQASAIAPGCRRCSWSIRDNGQGESRGWAEAVMSLSRAGDGIHLFSLLIATTLFVVMKTLDTNNLKGIMNKLDS